MLGTWLDSQIKDTAVTTVVREKLRDHETYRKWVCPFDADTEVAEGHNVDSSTTTAPSLSWKNGWLDSTDQLVTLIEKACFTSYFHPSIRS